MLHKGHFLVCGVTRSGKGMLMRRIAAEYRKHGVKVFVYTPRKDEYIDFAELSDFRTQSDERFFEEVKKYAESGKGGLCAIVDEAMSFNREKLVEMMNQFAAYGVEMWLQVQRAKMVPPNIRFAAENCISFRQKPTDADYLAEQYDPAFSDCANIEKGVFLQKLGEFGEVVRARSWAMVNGEFQRV